METEDVIQDKYIVLALQVHRVEAVLQVVVEGAVAIQSHQAETGAQEDMENTEDMEDMGEIGDMDLDWVAVAVTEVSGAEVAGAIQVLRSRGWVFEEGTAGMEDIVDGWWG